MLAPCAVSPPSTFLPADQLGQEFFIVETVLEGDDGRVVAEEIGCTRDCIPGVTCLALHEHRVDRRQGLRLSRRLDRDKAITAIPYDLQAVAVNAVDMLLPHVDQGHVEPALGEQPAEQAAHGTGADNGEGRVFVHHHLQYARPPCRQTAIFWGEALARHFSDAWSLLDDLPPHRRGQPSGPANLDTGVLGLV